MPASSTSSQEAPPRSASSASHDVLHRFVGQAARALGRHGLVHAYGHCSQRIDKESFLVCPARPMGLVAPGERGTVVPVKGPLPEGVLGEVRIHQRIYATRPDIGAVVRSMPPATLALSTAKLVPSPRHGMGAYFGSGIGFWDDPQLIRDDQASDAVVSAMGKHSAVVMRGNGLVIAADSLIAATVLTWYFEDAARMELAVRSAGLQNDSVVLDADECKRRASRTGQIFERMWEFLTAGDPDLT
ncbi:MAG: class II aldolase/adducin family protein [Burkholderiaceae bacterium]